MQTTARMLEALDYFSVEGSTNVYKVQWKRAGWVYSKLVTALPYTLDAAGELYLKYDERVEKHTDETIQKLKSQAGD